MYPYHGRIRNGGMTGFQFVDNHPGIGECLVLEFKTYPFTRPIKPHRYCEYVDILVEWRKENGH